MKKVLHWIKVYAPAILVSLAIVVFYNSCTTMGIIYEQWKTTGSFDTFRFNAWAVNITLVVVILLSAIASIVE